MYRSPVLYLRIDNLSISTTQDIPIISNVSLQIPEFQISALIGPSASGKTSFARAISGLLPQNMYISSGEIYYRDHLIDYCGLQRLTGFKIFYSPQNAAACFNPVLKIKRQILETAKISIAELHSILGSLNFNDPGLILDTYPFQLSGGENRRCLLALALAHKPELLILDEPTASLDDDLQQELVTLIHQAQKSFNLTILIICHQLNNLQSIISKTHIV